MRSWLPRTPVWFRLAFYFASVWALILIFRIVGHDDGLLFSWADVRFFAAMWGISVAAYYIGLIVWNVMKKHDRT